MRRSILAVLILVTGLFSTAVAADADPAKPKPPADADTSKVKIIIEYAAGPGASGAASSLSRALTALRRVGVPLGGLKATVSTVTQPPQLAQIPADQGYGALLYMKLVNRTLTNMSSAFYKLNVSYTLFLAKDGKWVQGDSANVTTEGSEKEVAGFKVSDCDKMADNVAAFLVPRLFPHRIVGVSGTADKPVIEVTFKNTSPHKITNLKLEAPLTQPGRYTWAYAHQELAPGEEKKVTFSTSSPPDGQAIWQNARVSEITFEDSTSTGGRTRPRR